MEKVNANEAQSENYLLLYSLIPIGIFIGYQYFAPSHNLSYLSSTLLVWEVAGYLLVTLFMFLFRKSEPRNIIGLTVLYAASIGVSSIIFLVIGALTFTSR